MYHRGSVAAFSGFAVAGDATGVFRQIGVARPVLTALHYTVGILLAVWLVAFLFALAVITLRRLGRIAAPAVVPVPPSFARRSSS
jgi:hypothetical protein